MPTPEYYNTSSRMRVAQGDVRDEVRLPLYDSVYLSSSDNGVALNGTRTFFQSTGLPAGAPGAGQKNLSQTNLRLSGTLESAVSFKVLGMAVDAQNMLNAARNLLPILMDFSSIELRIGEKQYWYGPMNYVVGRIQQASTTADSAYSRFGDVAVAPVVFDAKHAVEINPQQNFRIDWTISNLTAAILAAYGANTIPADGFIKFVGSMKGLLRRPVQ